MPEARAAYYGAKENTAFESWMRTGSQPGLMRSMSAGEHRREADRAERQAVAEENTATDYDAQGAAHNAHAARLNAAKYAGYARAHRELMGRKRLMVRGMTSRVTGSRGGGAANFRRFERATLPRDFREDRELRRLARLRCFETMGALYQTIPRSFREKTGRRSVARLLPVSGYDASHVTRPYF